MRISGVDKKQEGYVERRDYGCAFPGNPQGIAPLRASTAGCVVGKDSNVNFSAVRGALRWLPTDNLEVNFSTDYTNDRRNPTGVVLVDYRDATQAAAAIARIQPTLDANPANNIRPSIFVPPRGSYYNYASYYNPVHNGTGEVTNVMVESRANPGQFFEGWGAALDLDWKLSDSLSVKSISAWREYTSGFTNDNDLSPLASSIGDGTLPFHSFSQELRLNGTALDSALNYTVGGYFLDQQSTYQSWQDLRYTGPLQFQQDDVVNVDTKAAFGQIGYKATERAEFTAGIRYTDEHKDYNYVRLNRAGTAPAAGVGSLNGLRSDYDGNNTDYRLAAQYRWNDEVMTAVRASGGGVSPRPFVVDQAQPFGPGSARGRGGSVRSQPARECRRVHRQLQGSAAGPADLHGSCCRRPCRIANAVMRASAASSSSPRTVRCRISRSMPCSYGLQVQAPEQRGRHPAGLVAPFMPTHKASIGAQYEFALANGSSVIHAWMAASS
jgi:iron complex outermembrane receptor protein